MEIFISEFYSDDGVRKATIKQDRYHWIVDLLEKGTDGQFALKKIELIHDKTLRYAEDLAENYVMYVGAFK
jgi:hypothetical protein